MKHVSSILALTVLSTASLPLSVWGSEKLSAAGGRQGEAPPEISAEPAHGSLQENAQKIGSFFSELFSHTEDSEDPPQQGQSSQQAGFTNAVVDTQNIPLPPAPPEFPEYGSQSKARALEEEIDAIYKKGGALPLGTIKTWIAAIDQESEKVKETRLIDDKIVLRNQSIALIQALKGMLSGGHSVRSQWLHQTRTDSAWHPFMERYSVEGDINPKLKDIRFGHDCHSVVCILGTIYKSDQTAYEILFIYFKYHYAVALMAPRGFRTYTAQEFEQLDKSFRKDVQETEKSYQERKQHHAFFNPAQIDLITKILWKLPPAFQKLESLYAIAACSGGCLAKNDGNWGGILGAGVLFLKTSSFGNPFFMKDTSVAPSKEDMDWTRLNSQFALIHEISHALDASTPLGDDRKFRTPALFVGGFSHTEEWMDLSGWGIARSLKRRTIPGFDVRPFCSPPQPSVVNNFYVPESGPEAFVRTYSMTDLAEDFADHVAAYVLFPEAMKKNPQLLAKYEYLRKNVMSQREYTRRATPEEERCTKEMAAKAPLKNE